MRRTHEVLETGVEKGLAAHFFELFVVRTVEVSVNTKESSENFFDGEKELLRRVRRADETKEW